MMIIKKITDAFKSFTLLITLVCMLSACAVSTIQYKTETTRREKSIASLEDVKLNGLKHSILIRGKNIDNPILLYVHSLGIPSMCFAFDEYTNDTIKEKKFTVVHYDQRGFGKTYRHGHHGKKNINIDTYVKDAEELVKYLLQRFNQQKLYIMGESWGSVIGAKLVSKHPEWFYAYIAVPQVSDVKEYLSEAYKFALQNSAADSNIKAVNELKKNGIPSPDLSRAKLNKALTTTGKWMDYYNMKRYNGNDMTGYFFGCLWNSPEYNMFDFISTLKGMQKTSPKINTELINIDLLNDVHEIKVPVYVIIGEFDLMLNSSKKYFDELKTDKKYFLPVKNAGHMVRGEQYQVFDSLLYNKILPETL